MRATVQVLERVASLHDEDADLHDAEEEELEHLEDEEEEEPVDKTALFDTLKIEGVLSA